MENNYRIDIQGLRALSVLLVFCAHAGFKAFSGGYVGVDVFFVISGYVITALLLKEFKTSKKIKFIIFYGKRILRLLPALTVMVLVSLLLALIFLPPAEQLYQYSSAISSIAWLSNIYFLTFDLDYFSPASHANMFLHTWSLGVEEQFYLLWPFIVLWGLNKAKNTSKNQFINTLCFVAFISIAFQIVVSQDTHSNAFYLMPARVWQFSMGALIAYLHLYYFSEIQSKCSNISMNFCSSLGLMMIVGSSMLFNEHTPYPSWQVAVPSFGAALIIFSNFSNRKILVNQILSNKPMVWLGSLSYSFYLWHWPVLFVFRKLELFFPWFNSILAFIMVLALSMTSYHLVEMPLRKSKYLIKRPLLTLGTSIVLIVSMWVFVNQLKGYSQSQSNDDPLLAIEAIRFDAPEVYRYNCDTWYHKSEVSACWFGEKDAKKTVVLFGDSAVAQWYPLIKEIYPSPGWKVMVLTKSACPIVDVPFYYSRIKSIYEVCEIWRNNSIEYIQSIKPDVIVMGSAGIYPFTQKEWQQGTESILNRLESFTEKIRIMADTPHLSFDVPSCLSSAYWIKRVITAINESMCHEPIINDPSWKYLNEVADSKNYVEFLNFGEFICPKGICASKVDGLNTYRDNKHLTATFVKSLVDKVREQF